MDGKFIKAIRDGNMDAVRKYIFNNKKLVNIIDNVYIFYNFLDLANAITYSC